MTIELLEGQLNNLDGEARETARALGKDSLPLLLKRYPKEAARGRALILECLAEVKGDEAVKALVQALRDPESDVWNTALDLLHTTNSPAAVGPLTQALSDSTHARVRGEAARILGKMDAVVSLSALKRQASLEQDGTAAAKMNLAIARLDDGPERMRALEKLSSLDPKARYQGIADLEYINQPKLLPRLIPLLEDEAKVVNLGQERWPMWHRVCDRAVDAVAALSGKAMPFPVGKRNYSRQEIEKARQIIAQVK
ncbi:MAG TPA: HEAT repeat domain-containing protein [Thermodesulfobacteriota bacterium]|nr:HEAT repeat domain-containing protein [Thermodesulfobacteriota bacterium]